MGLGRVWLGRFRVLTVVVGVGLALSLTAGCSSKSKSSGLDDDASLSDDKLGGRGSMGEFESRGKVSSGGRFEDVFFAYDAADLDGAGTQAVRANAELLRAEKGRVEIEGHCDDRGTAEYNLALGARRAKSVRDALVGLGISSSRLSTVSYGEELPLCRDANEACWSRNRRSHLVDLTE